MFTKNIVQEVLRVMEVVHTEEEFTVSPSHSNTMQHRLLREREGR